jgi:hypothetical protein
MQEVVNVYLDNNELKSLFSVAVSVTTNKQLLKMLALVYVFGQEAFVFLSKAKLYLAVAHYRYKIKGSLETSLTGSNLDSLRLYIQEAETLRDTHSSERPESHWCYDLSKEIGADYPNPPSKSKLSK